MGFICPASKKVENGNKLVVAASYHNISMKMKRKGKGKR